MEEEIKELETIIFKIVRNKPLEDREKEIVERIVEKETELGKG